MIDEILIYCILSFIVMTLILDKILDFKEPPFST